MGKRNLPHNSAVPSPDELPYFCIMTPTPAPLEQVIQEMPKFTPFAHALGLHLDALSLGAATVVLPADVRWTGDSERGLLHSGGLTALADQACGVAIMAALDKLEGLATLDLRMDYLRPAVAERDVRCVAECHRLSRSVAFVRGNLFQPQSEEPVATVHAAFMRTGARGRRDEIKEAPVDTAPDKDMRAAPAHALGVPPGRSPYTEFLGVQHVAALSSSQAPVFRLPFRAELIGNPLIPALHGGAVAGFAETAATMHLLLGAAKPSTATIPRAVDFSIDYLRSARPIDTHASCTTVRLGRRVALVHVAVWQDDAQRPIATARAHLLLSGAAD